MKMKLKYIYERVKSHLRLPIIQMKVKKKEEEENLEVLVALVEN